MDTFMTREQIEKKIKEKIFLVLPDGCTTLCHVTMLNGYFVTGTSTSEPGNFNIEFGKEASFQNVLDQLWHFERYLRAELKYLERNKSFVLSPVEVKTIKDSGLWEDPIKRANAIREYVKTRNETYKKENEMRENLKKIDAPWGVKKDGTPRRKPGPRK
jgi:hypothetical protein